MNIIHRSLPFLLSLSLVFPGRISANRHLAPASTIDPDPFKQKGSPLNKNIQIFDARLSEYLIAQRKRLKAEWEGKDKAILKARAAVNWAREKLWLESRKRTVQKKGDLSPGEILCNIITKDIYEYNPRMPETYRKDLTFGLRRRAIIKLSPLSLTDYQRQKRDKLVTQLNDRSWDKRDAALTKLKQMERKGILDPPCPVFDIFQHCHTKFSFSEYYPQKFVWRGYQLGLQLLGIVDHDTTAGFREFRKSMKTVGLNNGTCGYEQRGVPRGTRFANMTINSPGNIGEMYVCFHAIDSENNEQHPIVQKAKVQRFRNTIAYLNTLTGNRFLQLDYDRDVMPLAEKNNPTERHLAEAIATKIYEADAGKTVLTGNWDTVIRITENIIDKVTGRKEGTTRLTDQENKDVSVLDTFTPLIREKVVKLLRDQYQPKKEENMDLIKMIEYAHKRGWLVYYPYLGGGLCEAESEENLEEWLLYLKSIGIDGIAFMPNRNSDREIARVLPLFKRLGFRIANGMDVNKDNMAYTYMHYSCDPMMVLEAVEIVRQELASRGEEFRPMHITTQKGFDSQVASLLQELVRSY